MNPVLLATLRRHWQLVGGALIFLVLVVLHVLSFLPTAGRYQRVLKSADQGALIDPSRATPAVPPRLFALLAKNSLPGTLAAERGSSGQLTVSMLEDLTTLAAQAGLSVNLTEPGAVTPIDQAVELRAHLKLHGQYREFVDFVGLMSRAGRLDAIERFTIADPDGGLTIEVWVKRLVLKQPEDL